MPRSSPRARAARALVPPVALAALAAASLIAAAQPPQGQPNVPFWNQTQLPPSTPPPAPPPPARRAAPAGPPVIARVGGRAITQADWDRLAQPYFERLKAQLGDRFDPDVQRMASFNVLDELIRRQLIAIEVQRQKIVATSAETDAMLQQDPFFLTNGKFDQAKFDAYRTSPGSNYLQVLPHVQELAAMNKLDLQLRKRFTPTAAQVRAEWAKRSDQVRFQMLPLLTRDLSLEPEATQAECAQYYAAHPDQFVRRTRVRLRYAWLPLPPAGDSTRPAEVGRATARAHAILDSLRAGTLADSSAELRDSGPFEIPAPVIPGLGRIPELSDAVARADADSTFRFLPPVQGPDAVIVGVVTDRVAKHLPPLGEVLGEVKRRADAEKRRTAADADRRAFHDAHLDRWRGPRAALTRVTLNPAAVAVPPPARAEVDAWYARHGRALLGQPDSARTPLPALTDSLRAVVGVMLTEQARPSRAAEAMARAVEALRAGRDVRALARTMGAAAETLSLIRNGTPDSLFRAAFAESLLASAPAMRGVAQGPRVFGAYWVAWRIDAADTAFVAPYEAVRARVDQDFAEDKRVKEEAEARAYFDQHRGEFRTPVKYGLDYVLVRIPLPDSVRIPEADLRRQYDAHPERYRNEEEVRARHILFLTRGATPAAERAAKARADSLLAAIRGGNAGDFGELAKRFSQEPGAATSGGELGWFGRGRMVKEFEEAAFALKPGEVSPVVKTQFGYHIIEAEDHRPAGVRPYAEARTEIRMQLAQSRGDSTAHRAAEALRRRLALGGDAKALAARHGGVVSATPIAASDPLPALGFVQGLAQDLPALPVGRWSRTVYRTGEGYVIVRARERLPERPAEFEEAKAQAVEAMKNAQKRALLEQKVAAIRASLAAGGSLDSLAAPYGGLRDSGYQGMMTGFVPLLGSEPRVIQKALAMKPGVVSDTLNVAQGVVWVRVSEQKPGDPAGFQAAAAQIEAELLKKRYDDWVTEREKTVKVEILRPDLRAPRPALAGR